MSSPTEPETVVAFGPPVAKNSGGPKRTRLSWGLLLLPWLALGIDFFRFPFLLGPGSQPAWQKVNISSLFVQRTLFAGNVNGYRFHVSLEDVSAPHYLDYLPGSGNALAISHYVRPGREGSTSGSLGRAVLARLRQVSPLDAAALSDALEKTELRIPGDVVDLSLHIPPDRRQAFPIDRLFIVVLEEGESEKKWDVLSVALARIFRQLDEKDVSILILPCLGYHWNWTDDRFSDFFSAVSKSIRVPAKPHDVYLSLYSEWPTFVLEEAVSSLNAQPIAPPDALKDSPFVYRSDLRLLLLLLPLCFLVCSAYVPLTVKNLLLITIGFTGSLLGSSKIIDFYSDSFSPFWRFFTQAVVWVALTALFPVLAAWDPMDLFKNRGKER